MPKHQQYWITLKNINIDEIDRIYGIQSSVKIVNPNTITMIEELEEYKQKKEIITFLEDSKYERKCMLSMVDLESGKNLVGGIYNCFWDHHPIPKNIKPIGCPIKYVSHQIEKKYYSELSKDNFIIKENITNDKFETMKNSKDKRFSLTEKGYYITIGAFCSFNCCMAYYLNNRNDSRFRETKTLLLRMYNETMTEMPGENSKEVNLIQPAHRFEVLIPYGGDISIEEFRNSLNKIEYVDHGSFIKMYSIGNLYEKKIKLS